MHAGDDLNTGCSILQCSLGIGAAVGLKLEDGHDALKVVVNTVPELAQQRLEALFCSDRPSAVPLRLCIRLVKCLGGDGDQTADAAK